jgi:DNA-binding response OmpR family regulator
MTVRLNSQADEQDNALPLRQTNPCQRILIVEDEPDIRLLNTEVLRRSGYHTDVAEDGAVAWEALQLNTYDLLLTDNNMPKMSGVGLLEKLHDAHIALPVIMATGVLPKEQLDRHPWLQIQAILLKPYTVDELLQTVVNVLAMYAPNHADDQDTLLPNWRRRPSTDGLRL